MLERERLSRVLESEEVLRTLEILACDIRRPAPDGLLQHEARLGPRADDVENGPDRHTLPDVVELGPVRHAVDIVPAHFPREARQLIPGEGMRVLDQAVDIQPPG